jgi:lysine 2,3-aminomutase
MVTHFNHPKEITEDAIIAVKKLICLGNIILLNQSVLLSGINDSAETLIELNYKLISIGIKPYYLHQCDEVFGSSSFRVPIVKGKALMKQIRGHISGIAVPLYVADLTGGGGKVPIPTDYLLKQNAESYEFQNYKGDSYLVGL